MTTYTFDSDIVSDLHKDAYGFRPSQGFWIKWNAMNDEGKQAEWDDLCDTLRHCNEEEKIREDAAIERFELLIADTISSGARDVMTAHRWIMQASDCNGDWDYLAYQHGLPYQYFK